MSVRDITLTWTDPNFIEKGYRVYRSNSPMDTSNMPAPIGTVGVNATEFIDNDQTIGDTNYYRVSAWIDGYEVFSEEYQTMVRELANIYTASYDNTIKKIDADGNVLWTFTGHTGQVYAVTVDYDGFVYSGSYDKRLKKIDPNGNQVWESIDEGYITGVAVDLNGYVYTSSYSYVSKIDPDGNRLWTNTEHTSYVRAVAVDDLGFVYSCSEDNTVRKIDSNGNQVWSFTGHTANVTSVVVGSNGFVYSGSADNTVRKIDPDGNQVWSFTGHTSTVYGVAVTNDDYVYSCSFNNTIRKINSEGTEVSSYIGNNGDYLYVIAVDETGYVYTGGDKNSVYQLNPLMDIVWNTTIHSDRISAIAATKTPKPLSASAFNGTGYTLKRVTIE